MRSRVTPLRNRRDVGAKRMQSVAHSRTERDTSDTTTNDETVILPTNISTADLAKKQNGTDAENQRSKRETPECVINYNSPRQLLVGCSQSNVVEVKPHCSDDGDEGNLVDSFQWYFSCVTFVFRISFQCIIVKVHGLIITKPHLSWQRMRDHSMLFASPIRQLMTPMYGCLSVTRVIGHQHYPSMIIIWRLI